MAVWTSSSRGYASQVVGQIFAGRELRFFWTGERCTQRTNFETWERYTVKDLRKVRNLGFALERVLMVDDSPEKLERHYGNDIHINPFEGDLADAELPAHAEYLRSIREQANCRSIEKRYRRPMRSEG